MRQETSWSICYPELYYLVVKLEKMKFLETVYFHTIITPGLTQVAPSILPNIFSFSLPFLHCIFLVLHSVLFLSSPSLIFKVYSLWWVKVQTSLTKPKHSKWESVLSRPITSSAETFLRDVLDAFAGRVFVLFHFLDFVCLFNSLYIPNTAHFPSFFPSRTFTNLSPTALRAVEHTLCTTLLWGI